MEGKPPVVDSRRAPTRGLWRIGRSSDPLRPSYLPSGGVGSGSAGNRFDSPDGSFGVVYFASRIEACFAETLIRFRPAPHLLRLVEGDWHERGFMDIGAVPADWRSQRLAVRARVESSARFLNVEAVATHRHLERALGDELEGLGYTTGLDVAAVRGSDRVLTRRISHWAFNQIRRDGSRRYAGIRYLSRLGNRWECWAVFQPGPTLVIEEARPIFSGDADLRRIGRLYELTVH